MPFLHLHRTYEEAFYVLEGELQFQLGSTEVRAGPGNAILVPAGVPHCFRNLGPGDVSLVVVGGPATTVTLIEEIGEIAGGGLDRLEELFERHESELLETHPHWQAA